MCGIAGYIGHQPLPPEHLSACLALMGRRGPDARASWTGRTPDGGWVCLLHSRLSILDLDPRSNQPFETGDGVLSFNGEIYNYLELRENLQSEGQAFASAGDAEVLARGLAVHGEGFLDRCEGMWAFAWFDGRSGRLLLSRDRFGEKPLYILTTETGTVFGSEPKFLFALLGHRPAVDLGQVRRYLVNGYKSLHKRHDGRVHSFFDSMEEVPLATVVALTPGGRGQPVRYWSPSFRQNDGMGFRDAVAGFRERLERSVELRLRSDVPLAFCLSGGIDSNALVGIARHRFGFDVHGFTVMNTDSRYEERSMVELAVERQNLRFTPIALERSDFLPRLREQVRHHDAPVSTISYYAQWMVQEAIAAAGYKVSISGTAADELLSGYYDHHNAYLHSVRNDPVRFEEALGDWRREQAGIVRNPYLKDPMLFIRDPDFRGHIFLDAEAFADFLTEPSGEGFAEERYCADLLRNRMANELFHESVPVILREDDLNAMYYSVENRSPFLDRDLFEFCQTIPTRHLIQHGRAKAILREAVRQLVPEEILDNPRKVGFNAPILDLLDLADPAVREWLLDDGPIYRHVRRDRIEELLRKTDLPNSRSKFLFYFINAKIFLEEFAQ